MRLVKLDLAVGGNISVNPDHVIYVLATTSGEGKDEKPAASVRTVEGHEFIVADTADGVVGDLAEPQPVRK
jgi:hypothetical protein